MKKITLAEEPKIPEQYRKTILDFMREYWHDRNWEMQENFGMNLELEDMPKTDDDLLRLMVVDSLAEMARAAAGELEHSTDGATEDIIREGVQSLCERLFTMPGVAPYQIPDEFWQTEFGWMVLQAHIWGGNDELITLSQAAEISGKSLNTISQIVLRGKLTSYRDPAENNPHRGTRVLRSAVENLK